MGDSIKAEERQIRFDNRQNQNSQAVPTLLVQMHLRRTDEYIEKTYKIYCDVWEKQGYLKTAAFIRAVSKHTIPLVISVRTGAVISQLSAQRSRTGAHIEPHDARVTSFKQAMERLAGRWVKRLRIEARECEHAERVMRRAERPLIPLPPEINKPGVASTSNGQNDPTQGSQPAAHARPVAPGVAQVSLADLNVPVGTSLKEAKRALLKLGAPARRLRDPRILEAADYKIENPKSTYKEVSIRFFRTPSRADSIRSWVNKRKLADGRG